MAVVGRQPCYGVVIIEYCFPKPLKDKKPSAWRGRGNPCWLRLAYAAALARLARRDFLRSAFAE